MDPVLLQLPLSFLLPLHPPPQPHPSYRAQTVNVVEAAVVVVVVEVHVRRLLGTEEVLLVVGLVEAVSQVRRHPLLNYRKDTKSGSLNKVKCISIILVQERVRGIIQDYQRIYRRVRTWDPFLLGGNSATLPQESHIL